MTEVLPTQRTPVVDVAHAEHEARHAVTAYALGHGVSTVSIVRRGNSAGRCTTKTPAGRDPFRSALETIEIKLAGGSPNDLAEAGKIASRMPGVNPDGTVSTSSMAETLARAALVRLADIDKDIG